MITIGIKAENEKITDSFNYENVTLCEVGTVLHRLEQIKEKLLKIEFKNDLLIKRE